MEGAGARRRRASEVQRRPGNRLRSGRGGVRSRQRDLPAAADPDTIAKSLAIGNPADGPYALELARSSGGGIDSVTDAEIREGIRLLAETTGVFTETAGGVTTAVLAKLAERGDISPDERVVVYITGEGLKTLEATRELFEMHEIEPTLEGFERVVERDRSAAAAGSAS